MAVELATAYISLVPSATGIAGGIERELVGPAGAAGKKAGGAIGSGMKTALAGFAIAGFLKGSFDEMEEAQKVAGQTAAVIASTGGAANVSAEGFESLASSISKATGLDDELVQSSENLLATFTNIQNTETDKTFDRATQAAVDLGAAMKMGPEAGAMALGKALNDPVAGMSKLAKQGVQLSAQQQQQVRDFAAVNNMAAAQGVILSEVERQVTGSAAAQATSADHLRVSFGNLQESVGTGLAPALTGLADVGTRVFDAFSALPTPLQQAILLAGTGALAWNRFGGALSTAAAKVVEVAGNLAVPTRSISGLGSTATSSTAALGGMSTGFVALAGAAAIAGTAIAETNARTAAALKPAREQAATLTTSTEKLAFWRGELEKAQAAQEAAVGIGGGGLFAIGSGAYKDNTDRIAAARKELELIEAELLKTGTASQIMGTTTTTWMTRVAGAANSAKPAVEGVTGAIQAAHEANRDRLQWEAAQIASDSAMRGSLVQLQSSIEAYSQNELDAAGRGAEAAKIRWDSAKNQIANAKAVEQAEASLVSAGKAVAQAQRGVADAYRARHAAVRGVAQAEQGVVDAERGRETAVRNLATANATLLASQRRSVQLARDLSGAFDAARESLDDLNRSAAGDKLSVKSAEFALTDARLAAAQGPDDPGAPNGQAKLNLAVEQAELALAEARDRASESAENLNERTAAGLAMSPEVIAAQQAVADNATTIAANQQSVADAQVGVEASDRTLAEAHQRVADAQLAVRAADQAIVDAKDQVVGARHAQQTAAEDLATAEKTAADEIIIADFLVWLSKDAAQKKSTALKDQVVTDMGFMLTAADNFGLGLAGVNAWLTTLAQGLAPGSPLRVAVDSLLNDLTPITVPASPSANGGGGIGLGGSASGSVGVGSRGGGYQTPIAASGARSGGKGITVNGDLNVDAKGADAREVGDELFTYIVDRVRVR